MYKRILLAYDGRNRDRGPCWRAASSPTGAATNLHMIAVMPRRGLHRRRGGRLRPGLEEQERKEYQAILRGRAKRRLGACRPFRDRGAGGGRGGGRDLKSRAIEADLIVVGHKHLDSWAARWWRGSVSKSLIEHASCNVLVVITS